MFVDGGMTQSDRYVAASSHRDRGQMVVQRES